MDNMGDVQQMLGVLRQDDGLKKMMLRDVFEDQVTSHTYSQADLIADVVNIMRMDTKRIAEEHGVEVNISQMTPKRAAELLQNIAQGDGNELIEIFDAIEDKRMSILKSFDDVSDDDFEEYMARKRAVLYSTEEGYIPPGEDDDTDEGDGEVDDDDN